MTAQDNDSSAFIWKPQPGNPLSITRDLTNTERMFVVLNRDLFGQNCPFIGASISVRNTSSLGQSRIFGIPELRKRSVRACCQTRWRYPTVAARVSEDDCKAMYSVDGPNEAARWAERSVTVVVADGGWLALREQLSRDVPMPSSNGDYWGFYLIVKPEYGADVNIASFDILMHNHHVFTDGSGIRSILNEFISRLADPLPLEELHWGKEVDRLLPPSMLLVHPGQMMLDTTSNGDGPESTTDFFLKSQADIGLPWYRPKIGPPSSSTRGSQLVSHTFEPNFLPELLARGRKRGVKLAAILHAALFQAIHENIDSVPGPEDSFQSSSAMDLRNDWMPPPYNEKRYYVNGAVVIQPIAVPCRMFSQRNDFWKAAAYIASIWEVAKKRKGMLATIEAEAAMFLGSRQKQKQSSSPPLTKPRTCPYFVSDPPGTQHLDTIFPVSGYQNLQLILESYQLATDQSQTIVSARSHSFHDRLTLCVVFNAARNPKEKMQEFLETWVDVLKTVCESDWDLNGDS
ncbi:hypothetical protein ONS95_001655 [Cadophora gregata]|uniref:uncharacterized protein n=1 Tax=Cadophora gregata TaxID=51156 RepID=UPI0026DD1408|nr:uncharacterized protein ONS95_001655 [Cadophora gregata]KAK0111284.1 hypothetical protein ONS95_001655 [Cadophora gregata]KAK0112244.1 hypothetical protein ONS96_001493 [Cadophora gregata f. sp. sojae]